MSKTILTHSVKPFRRYGIEISESIWIDGVPYFTTEGLGEWLGFKNPQQAINIILHRNPYIKAHTRTIDVVIGDDEDFKLKYGKGKKAPQTPIKSKNSRVTQMRLFSPVGMQLVAFESNTRKAKEYKVKVAELVWRLVQNKIRGLTPVEEQAQGILDQAINAGRHERQIYLARYMDLVGCTRATAFRHLDIAREGKCPFDKRYRNAVDYLKSKNLETKVRELFYSRAGIGVGKIWQEIGGPQSGVSRSTVRRLIRKLRIEVEG